MEEVPRSGMALRISLSCDESSVLETSTVSSNPQDLTLLTLNLNRPFCAAHVTVSMGNPSLIYPDCIVGTHYKFGVLI